MARPDPVTDLDWQSDRAGQLGRDAVDIWTELLERIRDLPVGRRVTADEMRAAVIRDLPAEPVPYDELVAYLRSLVLDHATYTGHPGFMAYISGSGSRAQRSCTDSFASSMAASVSGTAGAYKTVRGKVRSHHARQRCSVRRLTPTSASIRAALPAVTPPVTALTSTTSAARYTRRPRNRSEGGVVRFRQRSQHRLSRQRYSSRSSSGRPRLGFRRYRALCSRPPHRQPLARVSAASSRSAFSNSIHTLASTNGACDISYLLFRLKTEKGEPLSDFEQARHR